MENALESKFNPVNIVGRTFHSNSFLNKFNAEAELLDDLVRGINNSLLFCDWFCLIMKNDHWTAKGHKVGSMFIDAECRWRVAMQAERNWFVQQLQLYAQDKYVRVSFVSGDVHCGAVGVLQTLAKGKSRIIDPAMDYRYMVNVVTSMSVSLSRPVLLICLRRNCQYAAPKSCHHTSVDLGNENSSHIALSWYRRAHGRTLGHNSLIWK